MSKLAAAFYLLGMYSWSATIQELYDDDPLLREAIATLMPDFEYPDWSHKTVRDFYKHVEQERKIDIGPSE